MACAGLVGKRSVEKVVNELTCIARGNMGCASLVAKCGTEESVLSNELQSFARGDMASAGLVSQKRAVDKASNELKCIARGDMACAGLVV